MCQDLAQTLFRQSPLRSKGYIEIKMFQDLVLAIIVLVSYHNGLFILTYFFN